MTKRIGILGGISYESTIKYYESILEKYFKEYKNYYYPEIVIFSLDFQKFTDFENSGDRKSYVEYILSGTKELEKAGVDFILMAANSPHAIFNEVKAQTSVPMISIVEVTAQDAKRQGMKKLLLTGIKFTMQSTFYQDTCKKYEIEVITPQETEQDEINSIIFDELVVGNFKDESKKRLVEIINSYQTDGVVLGCTELPLIIKENDTNKKVLNTLDLHAKAALNFALEE